MDIQVTIGRVTLSTHKEMPYDSWADYVTDTCQTLLAHVEGADVLLYQHAGRYGYADPNYGWIGGDTMKITVSGVMHYASEALMQDLAALAYDYDQDAIPLTIGVPLVAKARKRTPRKSLLLA